MIITRNELRFMFYAVGIFACYFIYGMLQEKITRGKYGDNDTFTCTLSLVLVQCAVNYIFALILMLSWTHDIDSTRNVYYFSSALTYLLGMVCSNMALQWINYPTQVIGKAAKPIPVMILGVLIGHKNYSFKKYLFVFLIVLGVVLFMYKDSKSGNTESQLLGIGEILLLLSLTMDGLTGAVQRYEIFSNTLVLLLLDGVVPVNYETLHYAWTDTYLAGFFYARERIKAESSPTAYSMMLNTNWWSALILSIGVVLSGEFFRFITFLTQYPELLIHLLGLALTGALGQLFIFYMVSQFGPLPCSVVTTTRKFFTVLASVIIFGNVLLSHQWLGAVLVFSGLFLDIFYSSKAKNTQELKRGLKE